MCAWQVAHRVRDLRINERFSVRYYHHTAGGGRNGGLAPIETDVTQRFGLVDAELVYLSPIALIERAFITF